MTSEQKELQEDAARLRRSLLALVNADIASGTMDSRRQQFLADMAALLTAIAGSPVIPLEAVGLYSGAEAKPE